VSLVLSLETKLFDFLFARKIGLGHSTAQKISQNLAVAFNKHPSTMVSFLVCCSGNEVAQRSVLPLLDSEVIVVILAVKNGGESRHFCSVLLGHGRRVFP
jgi:hypothetical protein